MAAFQSKTRWKMAERYLIGIDPDVDKSGVAFLTGNGPDPLHSEDTKSDDQKRLEELEAETAKLLKGNQ